MLLMGVSGGRHEDPLFTQLKDLLKDEGDARHAFQASRGSAQFLVTVDKRSFVSRASEVEAICGLLVLTPQALESRLRLSTE